MFVVDLVVGIGSRIEICFSMAFVTYILVVGYVLGMQDRFSPEVRL